MRATPTRSNVPVQQRPRENQKRICFAFSSPVSARTENTCRLSGTLGRVTLAGGNCEHSCVTVIPIRGGWEPRRCQHLQGGLFCLSQRKCFDLFYVFHILVRIVYISCVRNELYMWMEASLKMSSLWQFASLSCKDTANKEAMLWNTRAWSVQADLGRLSVNSAVIN